MKTPVEKALFFTLQWEVGPWFNPDDPETAQGLCETKAQKRKTGYVSDPDDPGGETKFGIAAVYNPAVDIKKLTLADAVGIYKTKYWDLFGCGRYALPMAVAMFDSFVLHSPKTVRTWLADASDYRSLLTLRREHYYAQPKRKFTDGWINRVNDLMKYTDILAQESP